MRVKLTYFGIKGNCYSESECRLDAEEFELHRAVKEMIDSGQRPGLCDSTKNWFFVLAVPVHSDGTNGVPCLVMPAWLDSLRKELK